MHKLSNDKMEFFVPNVKNHITVMVMGEQTKNMFFVYMILWLR